MSFHYWPVILSFIFSFLSFALKFVKKVVDLIKCFLKNDKKNLSGGGLFLTKSDP